STARARQRQSGGAQLSAAPTPPGDRDAVCWSIHVENGVVARAFSHATTLCGRSTGRAAVMQRSVTRGGSRSRDLQADALCGSALAYGVDVVADFRDIEVQFTDPNTDHPI